MFEGTFSGIGPRFWQAWCKANPKRRAEALVTPETCIRLLSPLFIMDDEWARKFPDKDGAPQQIPYLVREVPRAFLYVMGKYGPHSNGVIPQKLLRMRVEEQADVGHEKAVELIDRACAAGLISVRKGLDRRYDIYYLTVEQLIKLHEIEDLEVMARVLAREQAMHPTNPEGGRTELNKKWYTNVLQLFLRHDATFQTVVARLRKLTHLVLIVGIALLLIAAMTDASWALTSSGGKL